MSRRSKRLQRIRNNPKNVAFRDLQKVLEEYGFILDRTGGSHSTFVGKIGSENTIITIPLNHPLKSVYVKQVLALIDQIEAARNKE